MQFKKLTIGIVVAFVFAVLVLTLSPNTNLIASHHTTNQLPPAALHTLDGYKYMLHPDLDPFESTSTLNNPNLRTRADLTEAELRASIYVIAARHTGFDEGERVPGAAGSGTIIDNIQCLAVTNHHVIDDAKVVKVTYLKGFTYDGEYVPETVNADVIGTPSDMEKHDIALLKLHSCEGAYWAPIGDSDALRSGDAVTAIGNPLNVTWSVSHGVVSNSKRYNVQNMPSTSWPLIQTDAAINSGNSGGGMFNANGELVGINSLIIGAANLGARGGSIGLGFAHPSNVLRLYLRNLHLYGHMVEPKIGMVVMPISSNMAKIAHLSQYRDAGFEHYPGVQIIQLVEDGNAKQAGMQIGDIILKVNGAPIYNSNQLLREISKSRIDEPVSITVLRNNADDELEITTISVATEDAWVAPEPHIMPEPYLDSMGWQLEVNPRKFLDVDMPVIIDAATLSPAYRTLELSAPKTEGGDRWQYPFGIDDQLAALIERAGVVLPQVKSQTTRFIAIEMAMAKDMEPLNLADIGIWRRKEALSAYIDAAAAAGKPVAIWVTYYSSTSITGVPRSYRVPQNVPDITTPDGDVIIPSDELKEMLERIKRGGTETSYRSVWVDIFPHSYNNEE